MKTRKVDRDFVGSEKIFSAGEVAILAMLFIILKRQSGILLSTEDALERAYALCHESVTFMRQQQLKALGVMVEHKKIIKMKAK